MNNISSFQIPPPRNWQDFESLCCDLWSKIWNDPCTQKNGRVGQAQHGVDVFGVPSNASGKYHGIQCKGKDNYSSSILTATELDEEVEKARKFSPRIDCLIIATTSSKDAHVEKKAREITETHKKKGFFSVHVFGWSDIVEKLSEHPDVIKKYYSWVINSGHPNKSLFDFWFIEADIENLQVNANIIPFQLFNVRFTGRFLNSLSSYLLKFDTHIRAVPSCFASEKMKSAVINFNKVANDALKACYEYECRYDIQSDVYTYWVDVEGLPYHEQGKFIEFKKHTLKILFYNLVKSANYVIFIHSFSLQPTDESLEFIGFIEKFNYNFPLFGEPHHFPECYPIYSEQEIDEIGFYQGLASIEKYVRDQVYKG